MFGQSALFTTISMNITRRVVFCIRRNLGESPYDAMEAANETAIAAGSTTGAVAAVLTLDPVGAALSAGYVALEASEAKRQSNNKRG